MNRTNRADQAFISLVKGEIALANGKGNEAIESLELSRQLDSHYAGSLESLAFAYRKLGRLQEATVKYRELLDTDCLGTEAQEYWISSYYELAKIHRELGDTQKAKEYCEKFFNIWKDANPDIPILKTAKAEYTSMK